MWKRNFLGKEYNYNEFIVLSFGSSPAALMKSGCTITTFIAIDRIWALWAPMKYYSLNKRQYVYNDNSCIDNVITKDHMNLKISQYDF